MGSVRKHGRLWQLIYQRAGKRHWETIRAENKSEAMKVLKIREGKAWDPHNAPELAEAPVFEELCELIETDYRTNQRATLKNLNAQLTHLRGRFADLTADKITGERIGEYITQRLTDGAAHATVNRELAALRRMLNLAHRTERIFRVPLFPHLKEAKRRQGFFEGEQFLRVLEALPEHLRPVAKFGYFTGWRLREVTSLTWTQVDWPARTIRLWPGETKSGEGRVLKLEGELETILKGQLASLPEGCPWVFYRRLKGSPQPHANQKRGQATSPQQRWEGVRTFYKAWRQACKMAGCPGMLFHDLRRTAARNFRRAGLQPDEAIAMTGHKTYSVFQRYNIVNEADLQDIAWRAQAYLAGQLADCAKSVPAATTSSSAENGQLIKEPVR